MMINGTLSMIDTCPNSPDRFPTSDNIANESRRPSEQSIGSTIEVRPTKPEVTKDNMSSIAPAEMPTTPLPSSSPSASRQASTGMLNSSSPNERGVRRRKLTFVEGDESLRQFPGNLLRQLRDYCKAKKTANLPCEATFWQPPKSTTVTPSGRPAHFELLSRPGVRLSAARFIYGTTVTLNLSQLLVVAGPGLVEPAIISFRRQAQNQIPGKVLYAVWLGLRGWEEPPTVAFMENTEKLPSPSKPLPEPFPESVQAKGADNQNGDKPDKKQTNRQSLVVSLSVSSPTLRAASLDSLTTGADRDIQHNDKAGIPAQAPVSMLLPSSSPHASGDKRRRQQTIPQNVYDPLSGFSDGSSADEPLVKKKKTLLSKGTATPLQSTSGIVSLAATKTPETKSEFLESYRPLYDISDDVALLVARHPSKPNPASTLSKTVNTPLANQEPVASVSASAPDSSQHSLGDTQQRAYTVGFGAFGKASSYQPSPSQQSAHQQTTARERQSTPYPAPKFDARKHSIAKTSMESTSAPPSSLMSASTPAVIPVTMTVQNLTSAPTDQSPKYTTHLASIPSLAIITFAPADVASASGSGSRAPRRPRRIKSLRECNSAAKLIAQARIAGTATKDTLVLAVKVVVYVALGDEDPQPETEEELLLEPNDADDFGRLLAVVRSYHEESFVKPLKQSGKKVVSISIEVSNGD